MRIILSTWLMAYILFASGHFNHIHVYGSADIGLCTSQCQDPTHHDLEPDCKGFPVNLTMGVDAHPIIFELPSPEFQIIRFGEGQKPLDETPLFDRSRAPPLS
ncbi:MAG: hypothetical protein K9N35_08985 [Candidatus Marinimicrobia bacterium]|nr:hypothetical protein [Candidatus Neomarinimicrobiota bacterium]